MTKAVLKTVVGESVKVEFGETDTPRDVLRQACEKDFDLIIPFFDNREKAEAFKNNGDINIERSQFSLIDGSEKALSMDFDIPILEQIPDGGKYKDGREALTFLVSVDATVGSL